MIERIAQQNVQLEVYRNARLQEEPDVVSVASENLGSSEDTIEISQTARELNLGVEAVRGEAPVDQNLVEGIKKRLENLMGVSETMAEVIAERIIRGYSDSILAS